MTMLEVLDDCVARAHTLPGVLRSDPDLLAERFAERLLADLDLAMEHCLQAMAHGEDMGLVVDQILHLKWLVVEMQAAA